MKISEIIKKSSLISFIEGATELFRNNRYKSKEIVEDYLGLAVSRAHFYGKQIDTANVEPLNLSKTQFNSDKDVILCIEGIVVLDEEPINHGSGEIVYKGYGALEVNGNIVYDGRGGGTSYVNSSTELTEALEDDDVNTIIIGREFQYAPDTRINVSGNKTILGSDLTLRSVDFTGAAFIKFHNTVKLIQNDVVELDSDTEDIDIFFSYVTTGTSLPATLSATGMMRIKYEKLFRGPNISEAINTVGDVSKSIWNNSAYDAMIARVTNSDEFMFAINDRSIHTVIIDTEDALIFSTGTYSFEVHPNKDIIGGKIRITGDVTWDMTGGVDLRFHNEFYLDPNATFNFNRNKSAKNFFKNIRGGRLWYNDGIPSVGTPATFNVIGTTRIVYEQMSDELIFTGNVSKEGWSTTSSVYTAYVNTEYDFLQALDSPYYTNIVVERDLTLATAYTKTLTTNKSITGGDLTISGGSLNITTSTFDFKVYSKVITTATATVSVTGNGFFREIDNGTDPSSVNIYIGDAVYEKASDTAKVFDNQIDLNPSIIQYWDNTVSQFELPDPTATVKGGLKQEFTQSTSSLVLSFDGTDIV